MEDRPRESASDMQKQGWALLAEAHWLEAREAFRMALATDPTPRAFEGLSWAAWWLDDAETVFDAREQAFRLYRRLGDPASAARMATWIAADQLDFHGAFAVAQGWLRRARRLLDPLEPGPDHGWLDFHEGYIAHVLGDAASGSALASRAAELGRRFEVPDLEMLGLALRGAVLVTCSEVAEGMACLDEAAAAALDGEATIPISRAWTCCFLVSACETVRDYPRAFAWCDRIAEFAQRYGSRYMLGFCRAHYGAVHIWRGRWEQAETELEAAIEAYTRSRPAYVADALAGLAELRRRQGRWQEAERLLDEAGAGAALVCRAALALDRGETLRAAELAERSLRKLPGDGRLARAPALEMLVRARARRGELEQATAALAELRIVERTLATPPVRAAVSFLEGVLAGAEGDHERARRRFEDALDILEQCDAPYEAGQARIELAASLVALGRVAEGEREARTALASLTRLGAAAEAKRAHAVLASALRVGADPTSVTLTRRERDVLRLVARGLTNRVIADQLFISEHTVHRHVNSILRKLDLPSRAAAAAHAVRHGLADSPTE